MWAEKRRAKYTSNIFFTPTGQVGWTREKSSGSACETPTATEVAVGGDGDISIQMCFLGFMLANMIITAINADVFTDLCLVSMLICIYLVSVLIQIRMMNCDALYFSTFC